MINELLYDQWTSLWSMNHIFSIYVLGSLLVFMASLICWWVNWTVGCVLLWIPMEWQRSVRLPVLSTIIFKKYVFCGSLLAGLCSEDLCFLLQPTLMKWVTLNSSTICSCKCILSILPKPQAFQVSASEDSIWKTVIFSNNSFYLVLCHIWYICQTQNNFLKHS